MMGQRRWGWLPSGILCLALWTTLTSAHDTGWQRLMDAAGRAYQQGDYINAEKLLFAAVQKAEQLDRKGPRFATSLDNLAKFYCSQGRYARAELPYRRSLTIWESILGPEHPNVGKSLNNLADLYRVQAKYAAAEPLYRRALAINEKALGPEHPNVATTLENYADLLRKTNREDTASRMEAHAKIIRAKAGQRNRPR